MAIERSRLPERQTKDGRTWQIGRQTDVEWIRDGTESGLEITSAIPPIFDAYATIVIPNGDLEELACHEQALLTLLSAH